MVGIKDAEIVDEYVSRGIWRRSPSTPAAVPRSAATTAQVGSWRRPAEWVLSGGIDTWLRAAVYDHFCAFGGECVAAIAKPIPAVEPEHYGELSL